VSTLSLLLVAKVKQKPPDACWS